MTRSSPSTTTRSTTSGCCRRISSRRCSRPIPRATAIAPPSTRIRPIRASISDPTGSPRCRPAPTSCSSPTRPGGARRRFFQRIVVKVIENTAALEANLLSGSIDMIAGELGLTIDQALAFEKRHGDQLPDRLQAGPGTTSTSISTSTIRSWPIRRVRQALTLGLDREAHQPAAVRRARSRSPIPASTRSTGCTTDDVPHYTRTWRPPARCSTRPAGVS